LSPGEDVRGTCSPAPARRRPCSRWARGSACAPP
jgi:hypothetical protein